MKNPANPGVSSTTENRGVVGSGMSETTNSTDWPIGVSVSITQTCGKPASEFEMLTYAWYALGAKMRAAEGGVGDFTPTRSVKVETDSVAQTSRGFGSRRRRPFLTVAFVTLNVASLIVLVPSLGLLFGFLAWAVSVLGGCLFAEFWIVRLRAGRRRASGGGIRCCATSA